jgi:hypothetical protein
VGDPCTRLVGGTEAKNSTSMQKEVGRTAMRGRGPAQNK